MQDKNYVTYEYRTKTVKAKDRAKEIDIAEAFGWEAVETVSAPGGNCSVTFRRDRKIEHKAELARLERRAEEIRGTISSLEKSKTRKASIFSWIFGVFSCLVFGGGMSLVMTSENNIGNMIAGIILGVAGVILCLVNYPIYNKIALDKTKDVTPAIDSGEEALANILEQGNDLLRREEI